MTDKTEVSVMVDRPVEAVWKLVASEPENLSKTNPDVIGWKQTSAGPLGVGTTFRETRSKTPKTMDFRVTEFEPNLRFSVEIISGPIRGTKITESMERVEGRTRLTETAYYNFPGISKLVRPFVDRPGKAEREASTRVDSIKHMVESEALT